MSGIIAFDKSRLSPDWFHQLYGEALPAGAAYPSLLPRYSYSTGLRQAGFVPHLRQSGEIIPCCRVLFLNSDSATHSTLIGAGVVERFSPKMWSSTSYDGSGLWVCRSGWRRAAS